MDAYNLLKPWLFRLDPERTHTLALRALRMLPPALFPVPENRPDDAVEIMGLRFPNPIGLAAGLDKNGECIDALPALGFGFIEVGTVTPRPQPGNPPPRLFRLPEASAIVNRMGFNNKGVDYLVERVKNSTWRGILGINVGKNFDTPLDKAAEDYLTCLRKVYPHASYVTVNISSPNTKDLRRLQAGDEFAALLGALGKERARLRERYGKHVPLVIKIAPDMEDVQIETMAGLLIEHGMDGVIATNTTLSRDGVEGLAHADEAGGLSGAPLTARATAVTAKLVSALRSEIPVIASGGVMTAADAAAKKTAGARLVQLYTGLVYRGPRLIDEARAAWRDTPAG
ncbi:MAG TPA: quinone-dependent dihydroorotate dehydrogenase [Methylococcaceae bacterium]|nr:quinone-dependent dihydroorotate dehydrogenase [Methylococcaceae bacterium]